MVIALGSTRIRQVTELHTWPFAPTDLFPAIDDATLRVAGERNGAEAVDPVSGQLILSIHNYVVTLGGKTIVIDSCNGNDKQRPALPAHHLFSTNYLRNLIDAGVEPAEVDVVACTHLHPDHCGWNTRLVEGRWTPTFPNARYVFARAEVALMESLYRNGAPDLVGADLARTYGDSILPVVETGQAELVEPDHELLREGSAAITMRQAPGHTPGHVVFEIVDGEQGALVAGDVIHHPLQLRRPQVCQAGDADPVQALKTRHNVLSECARRNLMLLTAHFPTRYIGRPVVTDDGYQILTFDGEPVG